MIRGYLARVAPHRGALGLGLGLLVAEGLSPPLLVGALAQGLAAAIAHDRPTAALAAATLAGVAAARLALGVARQRVVRRVVLDVGGELRVDVFAAALTTGGDPGVGLARVVSDVDEAQGGVAALTGLVRHGVAVVALGAAAVWLAPTLAPVAFVLVATVGLATRAVTSRLRREAGAAQAARATWLALARDVLGRRLVIDVHDAVDDEVARFARAEAADRARRLPVEAARALPSLLVETAVALAVAALVGLGAATDLADTVGFVAALGLLQRPLAGLADAWGGLGRALVAWERLAGPLGAVAPRPAGRRLPAGPLPIRLRGVRCVIGGRTLLDGVDLDVPPGARVGLLGPSGAGKSTLLGVIGGWVTPDAGVVEVAGVAVGEAERSAWRGGVAWVPQDAGLLARSAGDQVRLGRPLASVSDALATVGFVGDPDRPLGDAGAPLSGGERMRVAMARALSRRPGLLLLDEPTGPLDAAGAAVVLGAVRALAGACTVIHVAHDPAQVADADVVYALSDGRLARVGA